MVKQILTHNGLNVGLHMPNFIYALSDMSWKLNFPGVGKSLS